jgi:thiamine kinase-like enzyme
MPVTYQYIKIYDKYYCLQQNPLVLSWFLYYQHRSLCLGSLGVQRKKGCLGLKTFLRYQVRLPPQVPVLELPVYGHICMKVHRGYKVFNFRRKTVVKVLNPAIDTAMVRNEIDSVRNASLLDFAPGIWQWSLEERWYEEDYISGYSYRNGLVSQPNATDFLRIYYQSLEKFIEDMIFLKRPIIKDINSYINENVNILETLKRIFNKFDKLEIRNIQLFLEKTVNLLFLHRNTKIYLVFSHGDFSFFNILKTRSGIMVVDWESASPRNILYDLYNYFFAELFFKRVATTMVSEISDAITSLHARLLARAPDMAQSLLSSAELCRRLYYLERIQMLIERDLSMNLLNVIARSINVFDHFEKALGDIP